MTMRLWRSPLASWHDHSRCPDQAAAPAGILADSRPTPPDQRASHDRISGYAGQTRKPRGSTANRIAVYLPQPVSVQPIPCRLSTATALLRLPPAAGGGPEP